MASLQERNGVFNCIFRYHGKRQWLNLGKVSKEEAEAVSAKVDYLLLRLKQNLLELPAGCDIITFLQHDGKPPSPEKAKQAEQQVLTLADIRNRYFEVHGNGTLEQTTLDGMRQHFKHWVDTLGSNFLMHTLGLADLQRHVDRRARMKGMRGLLSPGTIKKEVITLRTAWNWAVQFGLIAGKFPNRGLRYAKMDQKPPFMTFAEIERKLPGLNKKQEAELWDALFLTVPETIDLLEYVKEHGTLPWIYPMFCFASFTGARRSEMIRARITDVDFAGGIITINEKKRVRGERTSRRIPMSSFLRQVLTDWLAVHPGGDNLFCQSSEVERSKTRSKTTGHKSGKRRPTTVMGRLATVTTRGKAIVGPLTRNEAHNHLKVTLAGHEKWRRLKGWHALRHSFISACATRGVDQRMVQAWAGHMTPEMTRRYTHLYPSQQQAAMDNVFS